MLLKVTKSAFIYLILQYMESCTVDPILYSLHIQFKLEEIVVNKAKYKSIYNLVKSQEIC